MLWFWISNSGLRVCVLGLRGWVWGFGFRLLVFFWSVYGT